MANTKHGLPQTKGFFKLRGNVTGLHRDNAFKKHTYDSGSEKRTLNFGIETAPESTVYTTIEGFKNDKVYLFKRSEKKGEKGDQQVVPWSERYSYIDDGFNVIGVTVGLEKDADGKNITKSLIDFDAAREVQNKLEDDTPVFVRGDIDYSSFKKDDGDVIRSKKFLAKNIYLASEIDFEAEEFKEVSDFKQKMIYMGIEKSEDEDGTFVVEAKIVTYNSIENTEFIVRNKALANQFKKSLKPYTAIEIWGQIFNRIDTDEVEESKGSVWGEEDSFKKVNKNYIRELVITGADPESIDTETYTEETIQKAIEKLNSQGQVNKKKSQKKDSDSEGSWGDSGSVDIDDSDLPW